MCSVNIVILSIYYLLQINHDKNTNHSMTVENVCQTTISSKSIHQCIFLKPKCFLNSLCSKLHHWANKTTYYPHRCEMELSFHELELEAWVFRLNFGHGSFFMKEWPFTIEDYIIWDKDFVSITCRRLEYPQWYLSLFADQMVILTKQTW